MIEDFVKLIPNSQLNVPGRAFGSGRSAFSNPASLYVLGRNPGGDPTHYAETVRQHTDSVLRDKPEKWSYFEESPSTTVAEQ